MRCMGSPRRCGDEPAHACEQGGGARGGTRAPADFAVVEQPHDILAVYRLRSSEGGTDDPYRLGLGERCFAVRDAGTQWDVSIIANPRNWWADFQDAVEAALRPLAPAVN